MNTHEQIPEGQLSSLLRGARRINNQRDLAPLIETVMEQARGLAGAGAGVLWLYRDDAGREWLDCMCHQARDPGGAPVRALAGPPLVLDDTTAHRPAARVARSGQALRMVGDAELAADDIALLVPLLVERVESVLLVPLRNHEGMVVGVLQLVNGAGPEPFPAAARAPLEALAGYAGIALNNLLLVEELKALFDAFVKVIAQAIDAKSPHTSAHCQRVPMLTEMLARAACDDQRHFPDFQLDDDGWYELRVAAWLHDCGKLATPDSVLEKSTKLQTLHDRIEQIATRFAVLRCESERRYEREALAQPRREPELRRRMEAEIGALTEDLALLERVNKGGETMAERDKLRVRAMATRTWTDAHGRRRALLSDDEVKNLCITRGTLTDEERRIINGHMAVTLDLLEALPFPRKLRRVPEYAGGHHERMDGSGFPRGLTREQMSIPARILAIADVFEALTARERPYKAPLKLSEALGIMQRMRDQHHLDPDLYRLFLDAGVWRDYALQALDPEQLDVDDATEFY